MSEPLSIFQQIKLLLNLRSAYNTALEKSKESGVDPKSIITSKTFWFNLAMGILQVADSVGAWGFIPQPYGIAVQSFLNIVLRGMTYQPVTIMPPKNN